jgi:hypothetical protein
MVLQCPPPLTLLPKAKCHRTNTRVPQLRNAQLRRSSIKSVTRSKDGIAGETMIDAQHGGGFSVDASVCIASDGRAKAAPAPGPRLPWSDCIFQRQR